jgi:putative Holliday junction resolvase
MRVLGLDIGEKRVGVAVSDPAGLVATPLKVLDARALAADVSVLRDVVDDYDVGELVVGLPVGLSGEEGGQATVVRETAQRLASAMGLPVTFQDERLSSAEARRSMRASGSSDREIRGSVDMVAAAILLQTNLDSRRGPAHDGENS